MHFLAAPGDGGRIQVHMTAGGCFSSSCTTVVHKTGDVVVDQAQFTITGTLRSSFSRAVMPRDCTADCGGAGEMTKVLGPLPPGVYAVWRGSEWMGNLRLPDDLAGNRVVTFSIPKGVP